MSRPHLLAGFLLMVICLSGSFVWCYADKGAPSYITPAHPLDALFRTHPSTKKHSGSVSTIHSSNGSDAVGSSTLSNAQPAQHKPQYQSSESHQQSPPFVPAVLAQAKHLGFIRRRAVEQGRVDKRHRWLAENRLDTFPAFQALPVVDYGGPSEDEDLPSLGEPRLVDTFDLLTLQPTKNELNDGSLSLPTFRAVDEPRTVGMMDPAVQNFPRHSAQSIDLIREQLDRIKQEEDIEIKSNLLMKLLAELPTGPLPIVYVEDVAGLAGMTGSVGNDDEDDGEDEDEDVFGVVDGDEGRIVTGQFTPNGDKRAGRYYRPYPWKRQNARSRTNDLLQPRNLCVPSREDVFKLLVSLHENRNDRQTVNFCNRKRPARAIFTNIRFLG